MPLRLSQLRADMRSVTLDIEGESLTITYRPSAITPEAEDQLRDLSGQARPGAALAELLANLIAGWDLFGDDEQPLPITPETLRRLPTAFLASAMQAIAEDIRPNGRSAATSGAGSLQRAM